MIHVLETGLLKMGRDGRVTLLCLNLIGGWGRLVFLVIVLTLSRKIIRTFVFMGRSKLESRELAAIRHLEEILPTY